MTQEEGDSTTRRGPRAQEGDAQTRTLNVVTESGAVAFNLPAGGSVVLGRSTEADLRVRDRSVSRRHARLTLGDEVTLEDLGSINGTRTHDRSLGRDDPAVINPGEVFYLGDVLCILGGSPRETRRMWPVGHVFKKVDAWAALRAMLAVLRVRVVGVAPDRFESDLLGLLGASDLAAPLGVGEALVALHGRDVTEAEGFAATLTERFGGPGRIVNVGLATSPRHGGVAVALMAHATRAMQERARVNDEDVVVLAPAIQRLHALLERVAAGSINVLLLGETGVGKEVFAARLHARSPRVDRPYVKFNCAALTDTLVEAELFGHEKGAFTGAMTARAGLIEAAHGGTLFLDEVGELSLSVQAKLLRALEGRTVRRVGATQERPVDVRFVAATNRDIEADCAAGRFRRDLYFRLNGITLKIPPLRERREEIEALARKFLARAVAQGDFGATPTFSAEALAALRAHSWPGNVRELRNVIERAVLLCDGATITADDCALDSSSPEISEERPSEPPAPLPNTPTVARDDLSPRDLEERARILAALDRCLWNQSEAARQLGVSRKVLLNRLNRYNLPRPHKTTK